MKKRIIKKEIEATEKYKGYTLQEIKTHTIDEFGNKGYYRSWIVKELKNKSIRWKKDDNYKEVKKITHDYVTNKKIMNDIFPFVKRTKFFNEKRGTIVNWKGYRIKLSDKFSHQFTGGYQTTINLKILDNKTNTIYRMYIWLKDGKVDVFLPPEKHNA